jgi:hypothetical protein
MEFYLGRFEKEASAVGQSQTRRKRRKGKTATKILERKILEEDTERRERY